MTEKPKFKLEPPLAFVSQINDNSRFFVDINEILKKEDYRMIKLNLDKVQADFIANYENAKMNLDEAKRIAAEKAKLAVAESEAYKAEVERHNAELAIIAEGFIAAQTANDRAVVELEAAIRVYENFTIVEDVIIENQNLEG